MEVKVKVHPGSSQKKIDIREGVMHLYIHAKPEKGKANQEAVDLLAGHFKVPKSSITLKSGGKSRQKIFLIPDASS